ncbi:hypothetical protein [Streptomyces sp. STR69]|uniref:hypothetical protein n=1 Tax=Streptomyces sp. STR69 TaxID=1796942 RepID=UPI0021CA46F5|nr:hypothetical protein [Streptomyces sp. STR69]
MTPALRTARTCTAAAILSACAAAYGATVSPLLILPGTYVGAIAYWCASRAYDTHRQILARHVQEQRAAAGPAELPSPCCQFWLHSDGEVHGPGCKRPVLPRRDTYRLDYADRRAFEEITAHLNDRSAS